MTERASLLKSVVENYGGLSSESVLRMIAESLDPTKEEDRAEYKSRLEKGTIKPINVQLSPVAKSQLERALIIERLDGITRNSTATYQKPGPRSMGEHGTIIESEANRPLTYLEKLKIKNDRGSYM